MIAMANCKVQIHLRSSLPHTTKNEVLGALKDSGVKDSDITGDKGNYKICVPEYVATNIMKMRDSYPQHLSLSVVPAVCVNISYCENVYKPSSVSKPSSCLMSDTDVVNIDQFLKDLKSSQSISYGVVVTFQSVSATYYRQFGPLEEIYPLMKVEVKGQTNATFNEANNKALRKLIFNHFKGHYIAWESEGPVEIYSPPPTPSLSSPKL